MCTWTPWTAPLWQGRACGYCYNTGRALGQYMSQVLSKKIAQITSQFRSQDTYGERENRAYSTSSQCGAPEDGKSGGAFQGQMGYPKGMKAAGELCHGANPVTAPLWPQRVSAALHCCKYSHRPNWLLATSRDQPRSAAALSQVPDLVNETKNNATVVSVFSNLRQFAVIDFKIYVVQWSKNVIFRYFSAQVLEKNKYSQI